MSLLSEIASSVASYPQAIQLVRKHKLGGLLILSFFLYLLLAGLSVYIIWLSYDELQNWLLASHWVQTKLSWLYKYEWIVTSTKIGLFLSTIFVFISIFKFVFLAIASPLFAYISERTAEVINQRSYPFNGAQFVKDIFRGILISMINLVRQLLFTGLMILLSFVPVVGWFFNFLIIIIDAYYYGFSMLDYNCERHKMSVSSSRKYISERRGLAIGNGIVAVLSLFIPIIGIILVAPLSVIAATHSFYKQYPNVKS